MDEIKKIDPVSMGKIQGILGAIIGVVLGLIYGGILSAIGIAEGNVGVMAGLGILTIIGVPILYGIFSFVMGLIGALIYNLAARWVGGIQIELK